jgi:DNA repair protein RadC
MISSIVQKNNINIQENLEEETLISNALFCLENRLRYNTGQYLKSSQDVHAYTKLQLAEEQDEVFAALFLTSQHQLISFEKLFFGTIMRLN